MAALTLIVTSLIVLSSPCHYFSAAFPVRALGKAAEALARAHFTSMALTLDLISESLLLPGPSSVTIFSPNDLAFSRSCQPPLSLLRIHFSPLSLSPGFLSSLPYGTKIPTAVHNSSLIISSLPMGTHFTLNGIRIDLSPLYYDEVLTVYGMGYFFNPSFQLSAPLQGPTPDLLCAARINPGKLVASHLLRHNAFNRALKVMRRGGYSTMASILATQLIGFEYKTRTFTLFAPTDKALLGRMGNIRQLPSLFLRHVVPCKLAQTDLANFVRGPAIATYKRGFKIRVRKLNTLMTINRVGIRRPELHRSDWIVVHGILGVLGRSRSMHRSESPQPGKRKNGATQVHNNASRIHTAFILSLLWLLSH